MDNKSNRYNLDQIFDMKQCFVSLTQLDPKLVAQYGGKQQHQCQYCNKRFKFRCKLKEHLNFHREYKPFSCTLCTKKYFNKTSLTNHLNFHRGYKPYCCSLCTKKFGAKCSLKNHISIHFGNRRKLFSCNLCCKAFFTNVALENHKNVHKSKRLRVLFKCNVCFKSLFSKESLKRHLSNVHNKNNVQKTCTVCFKKVIYLQQHMKIHLNTKMFICALCDARFRLKPKLIIHIECVHLGLKKYQCHICSFRFGRTGDLVAHLKIHNNDEKKFGCTICSKKFINSSKLNRHEKTHLKDQRFVCTQCFAPFKYNKSLIDHIKSVHEFSCKCCTLKFNKIEAFDKHLARHYGSSDNKKYICDICSSGYAQRGSLKRHIEFFHLKCLIFPCEKCNKMFRDKCTFKRHMSLCK